MCNNARGLQIGKVAKAISSFGCDIAFVAGQPIAEKADSKSKSCDFRVVYVPYPLNYVSYETLSRKVNKLWARVLNVKYRRAWINRAYNATERLVKDLNPDAILTSSSPIDPHLVGLRLRKNTEIPWIASFSDPWPPKVLPLPYNKGRFRLLSPCEMHLARKVLRACDAVHMLTSHAIKLVEQRVGVPIRDKSWVIPHIGSEAPRLWQKIEPGWLVHIGHLSRERVSYPLLEAIRETALSYPERFKGLICIGSICSEFRALIRETHMERFVKLRNQVSPYEAAQVAVKSTALLVIEANMLQSPFLPSKFADYAMTGRPIIAVTPPLSPIRDYLTIYKGGYAVRHDATEISDALRSVFLEQGCTMKETDVTNHGDSLRYVFKADNVAAGYLAMLQSALKKKR
jgi:hypothetical protein